MVFEYDAVIVGAGGAGLSAALEIPAEARCAVLTKVYPTRSHTGTAQGGIGAALGNEGEDHWEWHMFDTVKGSDYLGDQDAIEILCREAPAAVIGLEHMGLPFSRTPEGKIAQRPFGGHTRHFGEAPVRRACYAADRTGQLMLHTLYEACLKRGVEFFSEYLVLDLLLRDNLCRGVVAMNILDSQIHTFHAKAVLFATGGCGRVYRITSNAHASTGDGLALTYRAALPLEDMEFVQFHPTGLYKLGILISEAARGEGGVLRNARGERFMERYAPTIKDLAARDVVSRAMYTEIREGRGILGDDGTAYLLLDLTHLDPRIVQERLPDVTDFARIYLGVEPTQQPVPVQPTAHYIMGGIPTNLDAQVVRDSKNTPVPGFYAAGECACVSVHGANRLGTNALLDILVFGRRGGKAMGKYIRETDMPELPRDAEDRARELVGWLLSSNGPENFHSLRQELQSEMMDKCSVFRNEQTLKAARKKLKELKERYTRIRLTDRSKTFNTDLQEAIELGFLLEVAESIVESAFARRESRGAHYREDFPHRDDQNWLQHTLICKTDEGIRLDYKPVVITKFQPKERKY